MQKTGWIVTGNGDDLRLAEVRNKDNEYRCDQLLTYEEAKEKALSELRENVEPYIRQIARIEADEFAESGKLHKHKAWRRRYRSDPVVIAKTKKRAIELAETTRYSFDNSWHRCDYDWRYSLAKEEGAWVEERDEKNIGTGVYLRSLTREEAEAIAEQHLEKYRSLSPQRILNRVGHRDFTTHESPHGTPYRVDTTIRIDDWQPDYLTVEVKVDDCLGWQGPVWGTYYCEQPKPEKVAWIKEGF